MTQTKIIRVSSIISPDMMGSDWKEKVFEKITTEWTGKCTKEHGYILNISKIEKVVDQTIMRIGGKIRFTLDVWAEILKPEFGKQMEVEIDMITPHGLFCRFKMLRMLLPIGNCNGYILRQDFSSNCLVHPSTQQTIRKGGKIKVVVENVRYENDLYSCIVSLMA